MTYKAIKLPKPFYVGTNTFDELNKLMLSNAKAFSEGFPFYNIVEKSEDEYTIELAVAGFPKNSLDVKVNKGVLEISGNVEDEETQNYLHKGISASNFQRMFKLGEYVQVKSSELVDGILKIYLERELPEEEKTRSVKID